MTQARIKKAVFPVGGLGTRFLPVTKSSPKEMLPVVDKPLILFAVEEALIAGIEELIFVTGRGKTAIEDFFDHSYELNMELAKRGKLDELKQISHFMTLPGQISYIRQQEPMGLGHAVWCARHLINDEPFAVLLADDLIKAKTPCLAQMVEAYNPAHGNLVATMQVSKDQTAQYGILDVSEEKGPFVHAKGIVEKPAPRSAPSTNAVIGRYILDARIFDMLGQHEMGVGGEIQLTDALGRHLSSGVPLTGYRFEGERFDCGNRAGLLEATVSFALDREDLAQDMRAILAKYG